MCIYLIFANSRNAVHNTKYIQLNDKAIFSLLLSRFTQSKDISFVLLHLFLFKFYIQFVANVKIQ